MKIRAVIIDDEIHAIETLQWKLENYCPEVEVVAFFEDPVKGIEYLRQEPPDLLFLDIQMPMLNGFDVLEELGDPMSFDVILTTAYDQFGIQAVKVSALDYLLKPVQNKELKGAILKYKNRRNAAPPPLAEEPPPGRLTASGKIALATKERIEFVEVNDIVLCCSDSNYTMVYLQDGRKKLISKTLKEFEDLLRPYRFYRPHKSHLINLDKVKEFIRGEGGYILLHNDMKIPVSKARKEELLKRLS